MILALYLQHSWWRRKQCFGFPEGCRWRSLEYESGAQIRQSERSYPPEGRNVTKEINTKDVREVKMMHFFFFLISDSLKRTPFKS